MDDVSVIEEPAAVAAALDPIRSRILAALHEPASAANLATRIGLSRQKVNYHLKTLEAHGLVRLAEQRAWGGITERMMEATASTMVISPASLQPTVIDPSRSSDHHCARYLISLAARTVTEMGRLVRRSGATGKRLPTFSIDTEIGFASAADRAAFAADLGTAVIELAARYHHDDGRAHRLVVTAYPRPEDTT